MRETGILMPVSSLPSRTGVGELGRETKDFLDYLKEAGVKIWQILPLNPVGYGNSPYQPYSSCAGDEIYISLETLYEQGLLKDLPPAFLEKETHVRYDQVRAWKESYLREAFSRFEETDDYKTFAQQSWVLEYGMFRALKEKNENRCWNEWDTADKTWPEAKKEVPLEIAHEAAYQMFLQYIFFCQWMEIKKTANENGIQIMGDVPFYVGVDSVDVWAGKDNFLLDTDGRPTFIAGVPPDYFSATGQRWGNPIYDWNIMKKNRYDFWMKRLAWNAQQFDIIRLDHFRAFDTYWKIPSSCPTAVEGEWILGPAYDFFDEVYKCFPDIHLVAEDLGDLRPQVLKLRDFYHLKGMHVIQFEMQPKLLKKSRKEEVILYTGTHDNDTLEGFYLDLTQNQKIALRRFFHNCGYDDRNFHNLVIRYCLDSNASTVIIPLQDVLGLKKEGRLNTPGTIGSPNWEWKVKNLKEFYSLLPTLGKWIKDSRR